MRLATNKTQSNVRALFATIKLNLCLKMVCHNFFVKLNKAFLSLPSPQPNGH